MILHTHIPSASRRVLGPVALLAGLLAAEGFAAGTQEQDLATAIARRSFGATEALDIARRSVAGRTREPAAPRSRIVMSQTPAATVPNPVTRLDAVRLERTQRYRDLIEHHSHLQHVDAALVQAIVYIESGGDALAESPAGAQGLMQLMPDTARQLGVTDPLSPEQSIASGIRYLRHLLDKYGSMELALWAYNAGPGALAQGILPAETTAYVPRVLAVRRALAATNKDATTETVR